MMNLKVSTVLAVALASVVLLLVTVRRYESELKTSDAKLRQYASEVDNLKTQNNRLSKQVGSAANWKLRSERDLVELMKLRAEVGQFREEKKKLLSRQAQAKTNEIQSPAMSNASVQPVMVGTNLLPRDAWAFSGYQTPTDALESVAWAMKTGDVDAYLSSLTPDAEEATEKAFDGLSDAEVSTMLENQIGGLDSLPLDQVRTVSDNEMSFVLYTEDSTDGTVSTHDEAVATFVNIGGEWRFTGLH
ncbi:MAG: hypothetical protein ACLQVY_13630 [Limisphaerales bacterium]